eukprot:3771549-Pleurochrysis_carterae.AAC.1
MSTSESSDTLPQARADTQSVTNYESAIHQPSAALCVCMAVYLHIPLALLPPCSLKDYFKHRRDEHVARTSEAIGRGRKRAGVSLAFEPRSTRTWE